jgi:GTP pyrophosphokinase
VALTKTQVDRLGDRLRKGEVNDADIQSLDAYRRTFADAHDAVIRVIREQVKLQPTSRLAKTTTSIIEKLRREPHIRLTQIQDIAGCRVVVPDLRTQDAVATHLTTLFSGADVVDRRQRPSHGYRAMHIVAVLSGKLVEIQVRTELQHQWAELSEKQADLIDPALKYGGGPRKFRQVLDDLSVSVAKIEAREYAVAALRKQASASTHSPEALKAEIDRMEDEIRASRRPLEGLLSFASLLVMIGQMLSPRKSE